MRINERLKIDDEGKTFIPSNVEGSSGQQSSKFWNEKKGIITTGLVLLFPITALMTGDMFILAKIIVWIIVIIFEITIIRIFIMEEFFYKNILNTIKKYKKISSSVNYGILYINEVENGTSVGFIDGDIGCFVSLTKGSIVGKPDDYNETNNEIFSDFLYKLNRNGYKYKIINMMQLASKDKRIDEYLNRVKLEQNELLKDLMNVNIRYIKKMSEYTFYDQDIFLIYTKDGLKINTIIDDVRTMVNPLLQGAYLDYKIMNEAEIIDLHIQLNQVNYFDVISAQKDLDIAVNPKNKRKLDIKSLLLTNGNEFILTPRQQQELNNIYNDYIHNKSKPINIIERLTNVEKLNVNSKVAIKKNVVNKSSKNIMDIKFDRQPEHIDIKRQSVNLEELNTTQQESIQQIKNQAERRTNIINTSDDEGFIM